MRWKHARQDQNSYRIQGRVWDRQRNEAAGNDRKYMRRGDQLLPNSTVYRKRASRTIQITEQYYKEQFDAMITIAKRIEVSLGHDRVMLSFVGRQKISRYYYANNEKVKKNEEISNEDREELGEAAYQQLLVTLLIHS